MGAGRQRARHYTGLSHPSFSVRPLRARPRVCISLELKRRWRSPSCAAEPDGECSPAPKGKKISPRRLRPRWPPGSAVPRPLGRERGRGRPGRRRHLVGPGGGWRIRAAAPQLPPRGPAPPGLCGGRAAVPPPWPRGLCWPARCEGAAWGKLFPPCASGRNMGRSAVGRAAPAPLLPPALPGRCPAGRCRPKKAKSFQAKSFQAQFRCPGSAHGLCQGACAREP